ncbi:MAG TPA: hypothetical protein VH542_11790, partial [Steroidobacteraceae bacterium]
MDGRQGLTEQLYYDNLHRLDHSTLTGQPGSNLTVAYDPLGNLTSKSNTGVIPQTSTTSWYSYQLPNFISASGGNSSQFFYTPDRARYKQVASYGGTSETTIYVGGLMEKTTLGGVTSFKHYIAA